ncbi:MAG: carboxylating nicotinate-nucleotide diphosphorylase [Candidatus Omnitrophica bacterium]|nr:carboxylating nicotinate-nucleotide diphosphorylase [Candidatus Omnitrophota bacterium]
MSYLNDPEIKRIVRNALKEDIGKRDITAKLLIPDDKKARAVILAAEEGVICGIEIAGLVFKLLDNSISFRPLVKDGSRVGRGKILARIYGKASSILAAERVALNFLGFLSGIATRASLFVKKVKNYKVKVLDTRKTIPGLRKLEKYAVRVAGGYNHRFNLDEMALIKGNYVLCASGEYRFLGIKNIIQYAKKNKPKNIKLEIEVGSLNEFREALRECPDIIMLDNMKVSDVKKAVWIMRNSKDKAGKVKLEVSGNIDSGNICSYARTGVDFISLGTLTKDIHCLDLSLQVK